MPKPFSGKSRTCPTVARTLYDGPRYLPMVRAFAGDSTITSDLPAIVARSSGSSITARLDARRPFPRARDARTGSSTTEAPFDDRRDPRGIVPAGSFLLSFFALWRVFFEFFLAAIEVSEWSRFRRPGHRPCSPRLPSGRASHRGRFGHRSGSRPAR